MVVDVMGKGVVNAVHVMIVKTSEKNRCLGIKTWIRKEMDMKTIKVNGRKLLVVAECPNTASTLERFGSRYKLAVWSKNGGMLLTGANLTREQVMGWNAECAAAARALSNPTALKQGRAAETNRFAFRAADERCVVVKKACTELVRFGAALRAAVMAHRAQRAKALRRSAKVLRAAAEQTERNARSKVAELTHNPFAVLAGVS